MIGRVVLDPKMDEFPNAYYIHPPKEVNTTNYVTFIPYEDKEDHLRVTKIWQPGESRKEVRAIYEYLKELEKEERLKIIKEIERSSRAIIKFNL